MKKKTIFIAGFLTLASVGLAQRANPSAVNKAGTNAAATAKGMSHSKQDVNNVPGASFQLGSPTGGSDNPDPTSCCLGNYCEDSKNPLTGDYEIPLSGYNFNYSGDVSNSDKLNVGYICGSVGSGKLNAVTTLNTNQNIAGGGTGPESIAIYGNNLVSLPSATGVGAMGSAVNRLAGKSVGAWGDAKGGGNNTGGNFIAGSGVSKPGFYRIGVSAVALPSTSNPPAYTYTGVYPNGANIGIYGTGELNNSTPSGTPGPDWAAWFDGDVNIVGNCFWNTSFQFSDKRFKKDINVLGDVTAKISKLNGYTYSYRADEFKTKGFDNKAHLGLIAQEVEQVFPELVTKDNQGYYTVNYTGMIPVLLQAAKEKKAQIEKQQAQINELKTLLTSLTLPANGK